MIHDLASFRREFWCLDRVLFSSRVPERRYIEHVFTGRDKQLSEARMAVSDAPHNILVNGLFGIGKTIFIQELLRQLKVQYEGEMLQVYECLDSEKSDLLTIVLRGLAKALSKEDEEAANLDADLSGLEITTEATRELGGGIEFGIPEVIKVGGSAKGVKTVTASRRVTNAAYHIRRIIERAVERKPDRRIVIGVDDLDKRDPETIRRQLVDARSTLHLECSFVLTGHPLGILRDAYATAGGIFDTTVELGLFEEEKLLEMIGNYLHAGRAKKCHLSPLAPFSDEAARVIAQRSYGIPRVLNGICFHILQEALHQRMVQVGLDELHICWEHVRVKLRQGVQPELRSLLELLMEFPQGIDIHEIPPGIIDRFDIITQPELLSKFAEAIRGDYAIGLNNEVLAQPLLMELPGASVKS